MLFKLPWKLLAVQANGAAMPARAGPRVVARVSSFDHPKSDLPAFVRSHPLNAALCVMAPACEAAGEVLRPTAWDGAQMCLARANLEAVASSSFVDSNLRAPGSSFCAVSVRTPADRADTAAVTPDGVLHLSLSSESYEKFGLQGQRSERAKGQQASTSYCRLL